MGVDCVFYIKVKSGKEEDARLIYKKIVIAANKTGSKFPGWLSSPEEEQKDFEEICDTEEIPLYNFSPSLFAYCWLSGDKDWIKLQDGCRIHLNLSYQKNMIEWLNKIIPDTDIIVLGDDQIA